MKFCPRRDLRAGTGASTPRSPGGGGGSHVFHGKVTTHTGKPPTLGSGRGSRQGAAADRPRQVPPTPQNFWGQQKRSEEKCRGPPTRGGPPGRTGGSRGPATRQASGSGGALSVPDGRHGFTSQPHAQRPRPMLRVRGGGGGSSRYHSNCSSSGRHSATAARPHTPRRRPRPPGPRADWPRPQGTPRPGPAAAEGPAARAARSRRPRSVGTRAPWPS